MLMAWMQIVFWTTGTIGYALLAWWVMRKPAHPYAECARLSAKLAEDMIRQPFPVELQDDPSSLVEGKQQ